MPEIETNIKEKKFKNLLIHNVYFSFDGQLCLQKYGIAMASLLGTVIAGIFMVELEINVLPALSLYMASSKCYVDDNILYLKFD